MKKCTILFKTITILGVIVTLGLINQIEADASNITQNRGLLTEKTYSSPEEAMDLLELPTPQAPTARAWSENVPNIADQKYYGSNTWSGLLNVHYKTIRVNSGYNRTYNERKPSTWHFLNHRTYYWQFFYRIW